LRRRRRRCGPTTGSGCSSCWRGCRQPTFRRLAAGLWAAAAEPERVRVELDALAAGDEGLGALLHRFDALRKADRARGAKDEVRRWNQATDRFSALARLGAAVLPGEVRAAAERLAALGGEVERAGAGQAEREAAVVAAEALVERLGRQLAAASPEDCALRGQLAQALAGESR
jgi:hypothetical protein